MDDGISANSFLEDYRDCVTGWIVSLGNFLAALMARELVSGSLFLRCLRTFFYTKEKAAVWVNYPDERKERVTRK